VRIGRGEEQDMYQGGPPLVIFAIIMAGFLTSAGLALAVSLIAAYASHWPGRPTRPQSRIFLTPSPLSQQHGA
jgi:hypothetical protein